MKPRLHDGEQLRLMITEAGFKIGAFARLMEVSRNTPANWFEVPQLEDGLLLRAAKKIRVEPGPYFPRLQPAAQPLPNPAHPGTSEPVALYGNSAPYALPDCQRQLTATQQKLIETLEQYNKLLLEHNQVLKAASRPAGGGGGGNVAHSLHNTQVTV